MNKVSARCSCGKYKIITQRCFNDNVKKYDGYKCLSCIIKQRGNKNGDGMRNKVRKIVGCLNKDIIIIQCSKCNADLNIQYKSLKQWKYRHDEDYICGSCLNRNQDRSKSRSIEYRKACSERSKKYWSNPEYRSKMIKHLAEVRSLGPGPSSLERSVWRYLDDIGVRFTSARDGKSFTLGPWSFDIKVDKSEFNSNQHLLIEVDGF